MKPDANNFIPMDKCIVRRIYKIRSRNLSYGMWDGNGGFLGIRLKFYNRFLFTEYHHDASVRHGTVFGMVDTGIDVPEEIPLSAYLGSVDENTGRPVDFDKPVADGGRGWFFTDTNEADQSIRACAVSNKDMFLFLSGVEAKLLAQDAGSDNDDDDGC